MHQEWPHAEIGEEESDASAVLVAVQEGLLFLEDRPTWSSCRELLWMLSGCIVWFKSLLEEMGGKREGVLTAALLITSSFYAFFISFRHHLHDCCVQIHLFTALPSYVKLSCGSIVIVCVYVTQIVQPRLSSITVSKTT